MGRTGTPTGPDNYKRMKADEEASETKSAAAFVGLRTGDAPDALIFDCDGTLVETERDGHRVSFNKAFKELGYKCEWEVGLYGELHALKTKLFMEIVKSAALP